MQSMGRKAYDAFRAETEWLLPWEKLTDEQRAMWELAAQESLEASYQAANPSA